MASEQVAVQSVSKDRLHEVNNVTSLKVITKTLFTVSLSSIHLKPGQLDKLRFINQVRVSKLAHYGYEFIFRGKLIRSVLTIF